MSVVNYIADRICVMHKGKFVETGTTSQVIHHPIELYTKDLIDAIPMELKSAGSFVRYVTKIILDKKCIFVQL
jgi:ABC-type oligopeptide transport system ATPase subunit